MPLCRSCNTQGTANWVTATGSHHDAKCPRHSSQVCYTCKGCDVVGTQQWITLQGNHHHSKCERYSNAAYGTCKYCGILDLSAKVMSAGDHHRSTCQRYKYEGFWKSCCACGTPSEEGTEVLTDLAKADAATDTETSKLP